VLEFLDNVRLTGDAAPRHTIMAMHGYRIYFIDDDGHIKDRVEFACPDDEAAREHARQLADGRDAEL
jgi:hypothetical protein